MGREGLHGTRSQTKKVSAINAEVVCFQVIPVCPSLSLEKLEKERGEKLVVSLLHTLSFTI